MAHFSWKYFFSGVHAMISKYLLAYIVQITHYNNFIQIEILQLDLKVNKNNKENKIYTYNFVMI